MISEDVSEKKKRGRPPSSLLRIPLGCVGLDVRTTRGRQNLTYQQIALGVVSDDPRFFWITGGSTDEIINGRTPRMRRTILQALGRLLDAEEIKVLALELCRVKPTARAAACMIRRYAGRQKHGPDALTLANQIIRTINSYLNQHPETTDQQVVAAVKTVLGQVGASAF